MLGIIVPLPGEARCFRDFSRKSAGLSKKSSKIHLTPGKIIHLDDAHCLYLSGMGAERAEQAAQSLIDYGSTALLSFGTAGALSPNLRPGDMIIPEKVAFPIASEVKYYHIVPEWHRHLYEQASVFGKVYKAPLMQGVEIIHHHLAKMAMFNKYGTIAVDMETGAIASIAEKKSIPMACIRVIVDPADFTLPKVATRALSPEGKLQWGSLLWNIGRYPQEWFSLYQLSTYFRKSQLMLGRLMQMQLFQ